MRQMNDQVQALSELDLKIIWKSLKIMDGSFQWFLESITSTKQSIC